MGIMDESNDNSLPDESPSTTSNHVKIPLSVLFNSTTTLELGALLQTAWTYGTRQMAEEAEYYESLVDDCEPQKRRKTQAESDETMDVKNGDIV